MTLPVRPARFQPFPFETTERNNELDVSAKLASPRGWIDLEDGRYYSLHSESFGEAQQSWRKREVTAEWIEGTFPVSAVRDNVTEQLSIWVRGDTPLELSDKVEAITDALEQLSYQLMVRFGDVAFYYQCFPADYGVTNQHEFRHAGISLVRAQVPRLPGRTKVVTAGDEY